MVAKALKDRNVAVDARFLKNKGIGISRYLAQSVNDLIEAGANVTLLLDDSRWHAELSADYPDAAIAHLPGSSRFMWEQFALFRHLRAADYDVFIAPANYGLPLGYRGRTRLILMVHDVIPLRLPRQHLLSRPIWAAFYLVSTFIAVTKAHWIVTVSHSSARDIARLLRRKQVSIVFPRITQPYGKGQDVGKFLTEDFGDYFVYNGGADPRKNVPMLLRAMALLTNQAPTAQLVILGTGYDSFKQLITNLNISDHVHLLGYVSESRKAEILSGAVGLVYPSSYEGFGMPLIEGMAAGIPVITGTGGSLAEVGGSAVSYVQPLNKQRLASAMLEATKEPARAAARTAGQKRLAELMRQQEETGLADVVAAVLAGQARPLMVNVTPLCPTFIIQGVLPVT
jgi:glycosyltransferase involved in cell wall biosynthesis